MAPVDRAPEMIDGFAVYRRPFYWPSTWTADIAGWACAAMLKSYDYERAWLAFADAPQIALQGPFVVLARSDGRLAGVFDFSRVPADSVSEQFNFVLTYTSRDRSLWNRS